MFVEDITEKEEFIYLGSVIRGVEIIYFLILNEVFDHVDCSFYAAENIVENYLFFLFQY